MAFEAKKFQAVFEDLRARTPDRVLSDFAAGSVARTMYESFAYEIALLYEKMRLVYLSGYVETAENEQLDQVVAVLGIQRGQPDFATGDVEFERDRGKADLLIPAGTLVATAERPDNPKKVYQTVEPQTITKDQTTLTVKIQALNRGEDQATAENTITVMPRPVVGIKAVKNPQKIEFRGKHRETDAELRERAKNALISSGKASLIAIENALLSLPEVKDVKVKERFRPTTAKDQPQLKDCGIIDVFVDSADFAKFQETIQQELDRVRAAGIYAILQAATPVFVKGVFQIEINDLKLSAEERVTFEDKVQTAIETYVNGLKMGQPLLFTGMIKHILSIDGVKDLVDFRINTSKDPKKDYTFQDKCIEIEDCEKFTPRSRYIWVASETKEIPVRIEFQASALDPEKQGEIGNALKDYFKKLKAGNPVQKTAIENCIKEFYKDLKLTLKPQPWCDNLPYKDGDIPVSFVEQAVLGEVFAYQDFLDITGALKLTLASTLPSIQKTAIYDDIRTALQSYLDQLPPEADVVFANVRQIAQQIKPVQNVELDWNDFRISVGEVEVPGRITKDKIDVQAFEKARLQQVLITGGIETVKIQLKDKIDITLQPPKPRPADFDEKKAQEAIQKAVAQAFNQCLPGTKAGEAVSYAKIKRALENLLPGVNYTITQFALTATSADERRQERTLEIPGDIHIRSVELPVLTNITPADVVVTVTAEPPGDSRNIAPADVMGQLSETPRAISFSGNACHGEESSTKPSTPPHPSPKLGEGARGRGTSQSLAMTAIPDIPPTDVDRQVPVTKRTKKGVKKGRAATHGQSRKPR